MIALELDTPHRRTALSLARGAIEEVTLSRREAPPTSELPAEVAGVFVTLRLGDALRGCVGTTAGSIPLGPSVQQMAVAAATRDPRFDPVAAAELPALSISISVLGAPEPIAGPDDVVVGSHGLVVTFGRRRGLLLPQVARERNLSPEQFLDAVCHKAGLPPDAWRGAGVELARFAAEVFGEGGVAH